MIEFREVPTNHGDTLFVAKVPGGWLVKNTDEVHANIHGGDSRPETGHEWRSSLCFIPDEFHQWDVIPKENNEKHERRG